MKGSRINEKILATKELENYLWSFGEYDDSEVEATITYRYWWDEGDESVGERDGTLFEIEDVEIHSVKNADEDGNEILVPITDELKKAFEQEAEKIISDATEDIGESDYYVADEDW